MKGIAVYIVAIIFLFGIFFSCQRQLSFEARPAAGYLNKDAGGNCLPVNVAGSYIRGTTLGDSNFIEVEVVVTIAGNYLIKTDTVNGYSFKATGNFNNTGLAKVKLQGLGKPVNAGNNPFNIFFDTSVCNTLVRVTDTAKVPAVFALHGAPGQCINASVSDPFIKDNTLDTSAKVIVTLNVTSPGAYSISTNIVNGYNFSGSGTLMATGLQNVTLTASGKPSTAGTDIFTVTAGSSSCTFPVRIVIPVPVINSDYFPLSTNSYWIYDDLFNSGDTVKRTIIDSVQVAGNLYKIMEESFRFGNPKKYRFRKSNADYFEYGSADRYTSSVSYANLETQIPFLKGNLATGNTWQSPEYSGVATFGQVIIIQYQYLCVNANAAATINGKTFANVYKIKMRPQIKSVGGPWGSTSEEFDFYFAKGIGLIYIKKTSLGFTQIEWQIKNWQIN